MILVYLALVFAGLLSTLFTYLAVTEKDLLKAVAYSAGQSIAYSILFQVFAATDILLAYIAISVGVYSGLLIFIVSKTERFEV
ncbi:Na+/H+ antiporter subunit [Thermogladius calderae 1633]|uniref:Na+/H+ antiporter subunit n=1 Tax=Thermogladius calderae (strain DSM 22663 / VKM B-2946 / 1633) TaxID=1184251 RepID=I3TF71_THEC1|nr:hydrogenase subunit MbhD domain-containing protein [Thermogladius calderae]AFK51409.1 Na+/H+ antiporter subunit [Thermogladius calderae 1633]